VWRIATVWAAAALWQFATSNSVRLTPRSTEPAVKAILDPRRLLRWVLIGRLCLASAIFIAAITNWTSVDQSKTLVASLAFALSAVLTVGSAGYAEIYRKRFGQAFLYMQAIFDLLLVTAVVHLTNGASSPFAALYILVIATASLLVPVSGGLIIAALGIAFYFIDVVVILHSPISEPGVWLQLAVIASVTLGIRYLSAKLRESGEGKAMLAAALEQTRLQADEILRNIRSGVITVNAEGRLLYANPTAEQLLGISFLRRFGEPVVQPISVVAPELGSAIQLAAESKVRTTRGEGIVTTDKRRFPIGVTTTFTEHDPEGGRRTATAIFQDLSDQKRMDALRLRAERLEGIAELSASLAHEIKNPLASIRSAVEQIGRMPAASDDQKTLSALVMKESDRLSRLLSEFLDFARVRVAKTKPIDLVAVARGAARLADTHPDRDTSVRVMFEEPATPTIPLDGDEDMLHRAVFNLALNAVQAAPPNSEVRIEVARGPLDPIPSGIRFDSDAVSLRVTDSGPGIPADVRDRMFDPFFTTKVNGTGLGLAVVHRAIEAHRGLVLVDSNPRGTRFTVVLPSTQNGRGAHDSPLHSRSVA
jgi:two-component system sensor histidine kinase PilS (NtrC family)